MHWKPRHSNLPAVPMLDSYGTRNTLKTRLHACASLPFFFIFLFNNRTWLGDVRDTIGIHLVTKKMTNEPNMVGRHLVLVA